LVFAVACMALAWEKPGAAAMVSIPSASRFFASAAFSEAFSLTSACSRAW
jgi:hypothetical protein